MPLDADCLDACRSQHDERTQRRRSMTRRWTSSVRMPVAFSAAVTIGFFTAASLVSAPGPTSPTQLSAMRGQLDPSIGVESAIFIASGDQYAGSRESNDMVARSLESICKRFREGMARGDVEAVLRLYDPEVSFVSE